MASKKQENQPQTPELIQRQVGYTRWDMAGVTVEGRIVDLRWVDIKGVDSALGNELASSPRYTVELEGIRTAFSAPMQVAETLADMPMGVYVRITYLGEVTSANGRRYKNFEIMSENYVPSAVYRELDRKVNLQTGEITND